MDEQRTDEWFAARLGLVTASRVADLMAKTRSGPAASRKNYLWELACQRLTGTREDGYINSAMQRGIDLEPMARGYYEGVTGTLVDEVGFIKHKYVNWFGASPDGLVGDYGMLEIKCPNTATHGDFLLTGKVDDRYIKQMQAQMSCANRDWCDFVSFDDRLPDNLSYKCVRVERDVKFEVEMIAAINEFLAELDELVKTLESIKEAA